MIGRGDGRMRPLVSTVLECRWTGLAYIAGAVVFVYVALSTESLAKALFPLAVWGVGFGFFMYRLVIRKNVDAALEEPSPPPPIVDRETRVATARRVARELLLTCGGLALLTLIAARPAYAGGALLGMGAALIAISRRVEGWQAATSSVLWREPRYRWRRAEDGSFGGGNLDRRDFYVESAPNH